MLFSQPELAKFIDARFAPAWQSVRPAPQVTVDFGGGHVVRRTLHGNVATWVLDDAGYVLDVIGGVYTPDAFRARLEEALRLYDYVRPGHPRWDRLGPQNFVNYHAQQAEALAHNGAALALRSQGVTKAGIELWALATMGDPAAAAAVPAASLSRPQDPTDLTKRVVESAPRKLAGVEPLPLSADVRFNESTRRHAIHRILAETGLVPFDHALTLRIYRDALHCDLDDPWLGLGELLFATYPFAR